jgi:hypothetical protein
MTLSAAEAGKPIKRVAFVNANKRVVEEAKQKADKDAPDEFVEEICEHLGENYRGDKRPLNLVTGAQANRYELVQKLKHYQQHLASVLRSYPRKGTETAEQWFKRAQPSHPDYAHIFSMVGRVQAVIDKMDDEEALAHRRRLAEETAQRKAQQDALKRDATPDANEVKQLVATIKASGEADEFLGKLYAAIVAHEQAQAARERLTKIFDNADSARQQLGEHKPVKRVSVPEVNADAVEFVKDWNYASAYRGR